MSILSTVEGWFDKFGAVFLKLFKKAPSIEQSVQAFTAIAAPAAEAILAAVDPAVLATAIPSCAGGWRDS